MSITGFSSLSSSLEGADNYTRWIVDRFRPFIGRHVVEVGLGHANYRPHYAGVERYLGFDIDAEVVEAARRRLPADAFTHMDLTDTRFPEAAADIEPDTVLCLNVLQYVDDEQHGISNLLAPLRPGGHLCLLLPGMPVIAGGMDRLAGHLRRYSKARVRAILPPPEAARLVLLAYFNPVGALGWWVNNLTGHDDLEDESINRQIALFDRYAVPASRLLDPLTRGFFGQSLVCVIRKP